jgi:uncharacterized membrane protein YraQ (UPF0718 family)
MESKVNSSRSRCDALDNQYGPRAWNKPDRQVMDYLKTFDRTWLLIGAIFLAIAIGLPAHLSKSLSFTASNLVSIAPFLLLSAGVAGYLEAASADRLIGKIFSDRVVLAIGLAAIFGALSPFCSCGIIPLIAALLVAGVPLPAVMAFWVASPIMSPSMFVVTVAGLGTEFAVVKMVSAIAVGLSAGGLTLLLQRLGLFGNSLRPLSVSSCTGEDPVLKIKTGVTAWRVWKHPERVQVLKQKTLAMVLFLGKWLTLAFVLESLMITFVPAELLGQWLGSDSAWAIPLAAVIGVPAYLNGFVAVPVVAGLIENGMTPGAALSFMLAGAMTSIPAAIAVFSLVKRPLFFWYVLLALLGAITAGWAYQLLLNLI